MAGNLQENLKRDKTIFNFLDKLPVFEESVFIAPGVKLIGDVRLKKFSNIWFNSVLRGDINFIEIGEYTNIQDQSTLHVASEFPLIVGNYVTVGHNAILHACKVEDNVLVGMGSIILDNSIISKNCLIAAGSVIKPNSIIPEGKLVAGIPAKIIRDLTDKEINQIRQSALNYVEYANKMKISLGKEDNGRV